MARNFDGVDDSVNVGSPAHLDDLASFTWCGWIRPVSTGEGGVGRVFDKFEKILYVFATNTFGAYINRATAATDLAAANNTLTFSAWNFVAMTFDGTTTKIYHGSPGGAATDVSPAENGSGAPVSDNTRSLIIGNDVSAAATFNGRIEHARVFNAALSLNEITAVMYNRPVRSGNLVGYWPLVTGASPEPDWSGNAANGTVTGATVADGAPVPPPWLGDEDFLAWAAASSGVSGTIAAALADATSAISGTTTVTGSIGATLANHTSAISGTTTVLGTMAALLANATSAITGTTTVTGTIAAVLQACTSVISATTTVLGTMAAAVANAVSAITGDAGSPPPATGNVLWWFRRRNRR